MTTASTCEPLPRLCEVPRITAATTEQFVEESHNLKRPVIVRASIDDLPCVERWSFDSLRRDAGHVEVPVRTRLPGQPKGYFAADPKTGSTTKMIRFSTYLDEVEKSSDPAHYLNGVSLQEHFPMLAGDARTPAFAPLKDRTNYFLWVQAVGSVAPLHYDAWDNFLCQIAGRKRVWLFSPGDSNHLYQNSIFSKAPYVSKMRFDDFDAAEFPRLSDATAHEATLERGDVLFIPVGWWHQVWTLEPSISITCWRVNRSWYLTRSCLRLVPFALLYNRSHQRAQGRVK